MPSEPSTQADPPVPAGGAPAIEDGPPAELFVDPARPRGDLPPPRPVTPRGALVRSLLVPGWGLVAAGDRRGILVTPVAVLGLVGLLALGPTYAGGTAVSVVFLGGAVLSVFWAVQALAAWRRAARRRERAGLPADDRGAWAILVVAPFVVIIATGFWVVAGDGASPASRSAAYAAAWWESRETAGSDDFVEPIPPAELAAAWARQDAALQTLLATASAQAGPAGGIDPSRPWDSIRFTEVPAGSDPEHRTVTMTLVKRVVVQDTALGFLPATATQLVPVADIGRIDLRLIGSPPPLAGLPAVHVWLIERVDALGETIGP